MEKKISKEKEKKTTTSLSKKKASKNIIFCQSHWINILQHQI